MKTRLLPSLLLCMLGAGALKAAPNIEQWQWRNPLPQGNDLRAVAYGNGRYVAVGDYGTIISSPDGVEWSVHSLEKAVNITGVAFGNGQFVAVGRAPWNQPSVPPGLDFVLTSSDGTNWTERPTGQVNHLVSVAFGNGKFVAVGSTWPNIWPYADFVLTSSDGLTWVPRNPGGTNTGLSKVSYGGGRFVAIGNTDVVQTSLDGVNWTANPLGTGGFVFNVTYGAGLWIGAGVAWSGISFIVSSPDATTWTVRHFASSAPGVYSPLNAVAYGDGRFVATGSQYINTEQNVTLTSEDGLTWQYIPDPPPVQSPTAMLHAAGQLVVVGEYGNIATSRNGSTWTGRSKATSNNLRGIAYGNGIFVAVGNNGTNLTSPNGVYWTGHKSGTLQNLREITYAGQFVAVGGNGTIVTSPNGSDWFAQNSGTTEDLWDVTYGNGTFVAVGGESGGSGNSLHRMAILTSSDGANWTTRLSNSVFTPLSFELHGVTYGNGRFVAVGRPAAILTSFDGANWTTNSGLPEVFTYLKGVTFGNGLFVAVGETTNAWTSPDGITWTRRPLPVWQFAQLDDVAYGDGAFVAMGDDGVLVTSHNGIDWSAPNLRTTTSLRGAAFGAGSFVIVGNNDHILQSGTNSTPPAFDIVAQPRNRLVRPGASVTFEVGVQSSGALTYQWQRHDTLITNANGPSLALNNVQVDDSAYYSVVVRAGTETLTSDKAFLVVTPNDPLDSWSIRLPGITSQPFGITYGAGLFVAVRSSSALISADGVTWKTNSVPAGSLQDVTFGNGLFVACGGGGIAISANGIDWTPRQLGVAIPLNAVGFGNGRFVAVGGLGTNATTSLDGVFWTPVPLPVASLLNDVTHGNGQFVAVGNSGRLLTSLDGVNWNSRNSGTNSPLFGVAFGNGLFVTVGPPSVILTSSDGINWAPRSIPPSSTLSLLGITYAHGLFVAVSFDGTTLSSADGVNWTLHPAVMPNIGLRNVAAGPTNFVAVGGQIIQSASLAPMPPYILSQPQKKAVIIGTSHTLNVGAFGMPPPRYQWRLNGVALPGATSSNYTIASVQITNEGPYSVDVINPFGSVTSAPAEVLAGVQAAFLQPPVSQDVVAGGQVTLSAVITGRPPAFTYIWRLEGTSLRITNQSSEPMVFHSFVAPSIIATQRWRLSVSNEVTIGPGAISDNAFVRVLADSDSDGLPDEWESAFGFSPQVAGDGANDFDHDGLSNAAEYVSGSNPTNSASVLRFDSIDALGAETLLRFVAATSKTYTVQFKRALDGGPWQRLSDVAATATNRIVEIVDPTAAGGTNRFYRLVTPRAP